LHSVTPGGCLCGAVRYEVREEPLSAVFCHCRGCQLAHASPFAALALIPAGGTVITRGQPTRHDTVADSGSATFREFCGACGTHLFSGGAAFPEFRSIKIATLDDPSAISPVAHVWTERRIDWSPVSEGLPEFRDQPEFAELERLWSDAKPGTA
jgi:hypothetical protein